METEKDTWMEVEGDVDFIQGIKDSRQTTRKVSFKAKEKKIDCIQPIAGLEHVQIDIKEVVLVLSAYGFM